jgi:hypothetical protein
MRNGSIVIDKEEIWSCVEEDHEELALETIVGVYSSHH